MPPSLSKKRDKGGVGLLVVQLQDGTVFQVWKKTCSVF